MRKALMIFLSLCIFLTAPLSGRVESYAKEEDEMVWSVFSGGDGIHSDVRVQAQFLFDLGLFAGTEKGFELQRSMTRCEAAVMVVKFMGAQQEAMSGTWKTPFTDVPEWAKPYVGWLYENKITAGVSETKFGASQPVTAWQYCIFLSKAVQGDMEPYRQLAGQSEVENSKEFLRKDAVALSCNALLCQYSRDGNADQTTAQFLIEKGAFGMGQLRRAGWKAVKDQPSFFGLEEDVELSYAGSEGMLLQSYDATGLTIRWVDTETTEERNRYRITGDIGGGGTSHWTIHKNENYEGIFNGGGGLYRQKDGMLVQMTDLPAMDVLAVKDGSWILITGPQSGKWAGNRDVRAELIKLENDGTVKPLLTQGMESGFDYLYFPEEGRGLRDSVFPLNFFGSNMGGGSHLRIVHYRLMEVDRVAVTGYEASAVEPPGSEKEASKAAIENIKNRLRELGILYE